MRGITETEESALDGEDTISDGDADLLLSGLNYCVHIDAATRHLATHD